MTARLLGLLLCFLLAFVPAHAEEDHFFTASDGVRLHYIEAGVGQHTIILVPGWTMPAWIFEPQIEYFSRNYRVIALDPRGQGESEVAAGGYNQNRRGQDIEDLIAHIEPQFGGGKVLLVGWSLGVLDSLAYIHNAGPYKLAGLVLIDNSVGENPPPVYVPERSRRYALSREASMRLFVRSMFKHSPGRYYLDRLTQATLVTPAWAAAELLAYPVPRTYWKEALYTVDSPILYVVNPRLKGQAANVALHDPQAECVIFSGTGHALFIDAAARFNQTMQAFINNKIWP